MVDRGLTHVALPVSHLNDSITPFCETKQTLFTRTKYPSVEIFPMYQESLIAHHCVLTLLRKLLKTH